MGSVKHDEKPSTAIAIELLKRGFSRNKLVTIGLTWRDVDHAIKGEPRPKRKRSVDSRYDVAYQWIRSISQEHPTAANVLHLPVENGPQLYALYETEVETPLSYRVFREWVGNRRGVRAPVKADCGCQSCHKLVTAKRRTLQLLDDKFVKGSAVCAEHGRRLNSVFSSLATHMRSWNGAIAQSMTAQHPTCADHCLEELFGVCQREHPAGFCADCHVVERFYASVDITVPDGVATDLADFKAHMWDHKNARLAYRKACQDVLDDDSDSTAVLLFDDAGKMRPAARISTQTEWIGFQAQHISMRGAVLVWRGESATADEHGNPVYELRTHRFMLLPRALCMSENAVYTTVTVSLLITLVQQRLSGLKVLHLFSDNCANIRNRNTMIRICDAARRRGLKLVTQQGFAPGEGKSIVDSTFGEAKSYLNVNKVVSGELKTPDQVARVLEERMGNTTVVRFSINDSVSSSANHTLFIKGGARCKGEGNKTNAMKKWAHSFVFDTASTAAVASAYMHIDGSNVKEFDDRGFSSKQERKSGRGMHAAGAERLKGLEYPMVLKAEDEDNFEAVDVEIKTNSKVRAPQLGSANAILRRGGGRMSMPPGVVHGEAMPVVLWDGAKLSDMPDVLQPRGMLMRIGKHAASKAGEPLHTLVRWYVEREVRTGKMMVGVVDRSVTNTESSRRITRRKFPIVAFMKDTDVLASMARVGLDEWPNNLAIMRAGNQAFEDIIVNGLGALEFSFLKWGTPILDKNPWRTDEWSDNPTYLDEKVSSFVAQDAAPRNIARAIKKRAARKESKKVSGRPRSSGRAKSSAGSTRAQPKNEVEADSSEDCEYAAASDSAVESDEGGYGPAENEVEAESSEDCDFAATSDSAAESEGGGYGPADA